jgi:fructan beta-fructosidase
MPQMSPNIVRPQIHFTAPAGWLNDPNGLVYYKGEYHLFYQHNPDSIDWGNIHWGHAVSSDFAHWEHLPEALYPDAIGTIWSGSIVVDDRNTSGLLPDGGLVALFSYNDQSQGLAYSSDKGRTWTKYAHNPVLSNDGSKDFRDPKVMWYEPKQCWLMTIAVNTTVRFYTSPNLIDWDFKSVVVDYTNPADSVWECPDLLPFTTPDGQTKWVSYFSLSEGGAPAGGSGTCYYVGDFDDGDFIFLGDGSKRLWMDAGKDSYAGTTWSNIGDGRTVFIGWMTNQRYSGRIPASTWRGCMTIPREWSLKQMASGWRLVQKPLRELEILRSASPIEIKGHISDGQSLDCGGINSAVELDVQLQIGAAVKCGLRLSAGEQKVTIGVDRQAKQIFVDRTASGGFDNPDFLQRHSAALETTESVHLRVFIDTNAVEVFVNEGEIVFSELLFMDATNRQLELYASGDEAVVQEGCLYTLSSIYQTKP